MDEKINVDQDIKYLGIWLMIFGIIMWIVGFNNIPDSDYDVTIKETFKPAFLLL